MTRALFHLAVNVRDLAATRAFYTGLLGCPEGRSAPTWVDFDFFGHQLSCHLGEPFATADTGQVDGIAVPMPHLGAVLPLDAWSGCRQNLEAAGVAVDWVFRPLVRYRGQPGEQHVLFVRDPSGNPIELKGFADMGEVYAV